MAITHVIRGEDLLAVDAQGAPAPPGARRRPSVPVFAHLPLLVNEKRQKLSKRRDDVAVEEYRERGYLPEAMRNYLALLGWSPADDREILPDRGDGRRVPARGRQARRRRSSTSRSSTHVNGEYIRALPVATFVRESLPWLETDPPWPPERFDLAVFEAVAPLVQERVRTLAEVPAMVDFLFLEEPAIDEAAWEKAVARSPAAAGAARRRHRRATGTATGTPTRCTGVTARAGRAATG